MSEDDDQDLEVVQRVGSAAAAPSIKTNAPRSVFDWRPAGADLPDATPPPNPESTSMPKTKSAPKTRPDSGGNASPQAQVCNTLATRPGSWPYAELRQACNQLDDDQFRNAIYNCAKAKRIRRNGHAFELTKVGREFAGIAAVGDALKPKARKAVKPGRTAKPAKATRKTAPKGPDTKVPRKAAKPRRGSLSLVTNVTRAPTPVGARDPWALITTVDVQPVRFAAFSDGSFMVEKNGAQVLLTAQEHSDMRAYQERMQ